MSKPKLKGLAAALSVNVSRLEKDIQAVNYGSRRAATKTFLDDMRAAAREELSTAERKSKKLFAVGAGPKRTDPIQIIGFRAGDGTVTLSRASARILLDQLAHLLRRRS
jgi:hypothetical protein